jgi:ABC-2 type transport system permease protein
VRAIWEVFRYEFIKNIGRKGYLFATFGLPLIIFAGIVLFNAVQARATNDTEDASDTPEFDFEGIQKAGIVDSFGVFPTISDALKDVLIRYSDPTSASTALQNGEVDVFYVIPQDYLQTGEVILHLPGVSLGMMNGQPIEQLFYTTLASDIDRDLLTRLRNPIELKEFNLTRSADEENDDDANFAMLYIFAILFLLGLFLTNGYLLQSVIEEKENRVIEILITSIRATDLLTGKILAMGILGIVQIIVWFGSAIGLLILSVSLPAFQTMTSLLNIRIPYEQLPIMFAYFVLGYLLFAAIFGAVGALSNSMREGPGYAAMFTLPAALPFYLFSVFLATPNAPLPTVLSIFPITAPISMMMRLSIGSVPTIEIVISLTLLAITTLFAMWLAGRLFRVQALLSGKVPKLRDIPNLIRG